MEGFYKLLFWLILVGVFTIVRVIAGKAKTPRTHAPEFRGRPQRHPYPQPDDVEEPEQDLTMVAPKVPEVPKAPAPFLSTDEGERVTAPRKVPEPTPQERVGLRNRENLKRAIIFGEILAPKF